MIFFQEEHKAGQDTLPGQLYKRKKPRQGEMPHNSCREGGSVPQPASRLFLCIEIVMDRLVPPQHLTGIINKMWASPFSLTCNKVVSLREAYTQEQRANFEHSWVPFQ